MTTAVKFETDQIPAINEVLKDESPPVILRWAVETFGSGLTMGTAFGVEGCCILSMLAEIDPAVHVFNLETGYQFKETLELRERIREKYGIEVEFVYPEKSVPEYEADHGGPLYLIRADQCCYDRKIRPLKKIAQGKDAWISSIRREQTQHRANAQVVQWDEKFGLVKINPLLSWSHKDVWAFAVENEVPYNPLHDQGYPSIGCWPCTQPVGQGEDERAGRWAGTLKKECGLHVIEHQDGSGI